MPRPPASQTRTGRPPVTSRAQILAGARRLIDRDGWERLSIRGLAAELGIGPTTLYHHVRDKEDLLLLLITEYADQIPHPELPAEPRDRIILAATAIHDALADWPWAAEVLAVDGFIARIGESALWFVEVILAGAVDAGCTREEAIRLFRGLWYYTVGEILVRARSRREQVDYTNSDALFEDRDMSGLPQLASVKDLWGPVAARDNFPQGLEAFVDGLLLQATRKS